MSKQGELPQTYDIFHGVFSELRFPFFSANTVALAGLLMDSRVMEGCQLQLDLPAPTPERQMCAYQAFRALLRSIDVPYQFAAYLAQSNVVKASPGASATLALLLSLPRLGYSVESKNGAIRWSGLSPWPAAFASILMHLANLYRVNALLITHKKGQMDQALNDAGFASDGNEILDQTSRVMPTTLHYAAASLGAWAAGAANVQYFSHYASAPQIRDPKINQRYAEKIGYTTSDAQLLSASGIIALPESLVYPLALAQNSLTAFGALPIDEWNVVNMPLESAMRHTGAEGDFLPGFLLEKNYRAPFYARTLKEHALFGNEEVLRDHYADFYKSVPTEDLIRCKHYCSPVIDVTSLNEINELVERIPNRSDEGLFFRGQSRFYPISRTPEIQRLLFGKSRRREPSLVTAAARTKFDYDALHFALRYFVEQELFGKLGAGAAKTPLYKKWLEHGQRYTCDIDYAVMALAQHYGIASHGLDVTSDIDIALWFATNKWENGPQASYKKIAPADWPAEKTLWPTVFVCQQVTHSLSGSLRNCSELDAFGIHAMRPVRQKASFFLGGHSDHQNRLAETVVCALRLAPGDWPTTSSFEDLFPPPDEDPAYALMLKFAQSPEFASMGADQVARYH